VEKVSTHLIRNGEKNPYRFAESRLSKKLGPCLKLIRREGISIILERPDRLASRQVPKKLFPPGGRISVGIDQERSLSGVPTEVSSHSRIMTKTPPSIVPRTKASRVLTHLEAQGKRAAEVARWTRLTSWISPAL